MFPEIGGSPKPSKVNCYFHSISTIWHDQLKLSHFWSQLVAIVAIVAIIAIVAIVAIVAITPLPCGGSAIASIQTFHGAEYLRISDGPLLVYPSGEASREMIRNLDREIHLNQ